MNESTELVSNKHIYRRICYEIIGGPEYVNRSCDSFQVVRLWSFSSVAV